MECGHCYAICPQGAIIMTNYESTDEKVVLMSEIDPETLLKAMKSRRTIRQFKPNPVEDEKIEKILEAGRYSPTGANRQMVSYTILGSKQREAEEICLNLFRKGKRFGSAFTSYLKRIEIDDDFFFKGAPLVIVIASKSTVDGGLASSYMEIMAESLGLGVLYSGFFVICSKMSRKLKKLLKLEKGYEVEAAFDGTTGLKMARANEYDVIFLDTFEPEQRSFLLIYLTYIIIYEYKVNINLPTEGLLIN